MDCGSCGVVNAPGRRYCRECGSRLGQPCPVCHFFNGVADKHCGGCGRRLKTGAGPLVEEAPPLASYAPAPAEALEFGDIAERKPAPSAAETSVADQDVSQSEIDGLFENILEEDSGQSDEPAGGGE